MNEAISAITSSGITGSLLVVVGFVFWRHIQARVVADQARIAALETELKRINEARVEASQRSAEQQLVREDKWMALFEREDGKT